MVVTNGRYTGPARDEAGQHGVTLWDRDHLAELILALNDPDRGVPVPGMLAWLMNASHRPTASYLRPSAPAHTYLCAMCGRHVTERVRSYCLERPGRFGGRVYCMPHQGAAAVARATSERDEGPQVH